MAEQPRYMGGQAVVEGVMMRGAAPGPSPCALPTATSTSRCTTRPAGPSGRRRSRSSAASSTSPSRWRSACRRYLVGEPAGPRGGADRRQGAWASRWRRARLLRRAVHRAPALGAPRPVEPARHRRLRVPRARGRLRASGSSSATSPLIGRCRDIKRVFQYHGAEHKAIAAYENDVPLTPESAQRFTTQHVRCGTNFLLTVLVIAILVYSLIGRPALPSCALADRPDPGDRRPRLRGHPLAASHMDRRWVRIRWCPGSPSRS